MSRLTVVLILSMGVLFMFARKMLMAGEKLPMEDGTSAATVLPLDRDASRVAFQTATFGLG